MTTTHLMRAVETVDGTRTDVLVRDGVVVELGSGLSAAGAEVIDADGLLALPGLVDLHTHLREPGGEGAETVLTGSRAAAAGGTPFDYAMEVPGMHGRSFADPDGHQWEVIHTDPSFFGG